MYAADSISAKISGFLEFLRVENLLSDAKLQRIKTAMDGSGHSLDLVITELGFLSEDDLLEHYSNYFEFEYIHELALADISSANELGISYLQSNSIVPLANGADAIKIAVADPFDNSTLSTIQYFFDQNIELVVAKRKSINSLLEGLNTTDNSSANIEVDEAFETSEVDMERLHDIAREAPIVQLASRIIQDGVNQSATDIHIEPWEDFVRIRFRIDGILTEYENVSKSMHAGLNTRFKILSGMNISERRLPQDGRMRISVRGQETDFRVSSVPSIHGETIVIRILQRSTELLVLQNLGFDDASQGKLNRILTSPNGITLVTGPTGSGKTTTLYSLLNQLNDGSSKIFTVEDPVEYRLDGVTQLQVDASIGLDFADTLRSVLRQDPDTILVGEIRDLETAKIAIQAALTGHRVLATLHTNSAIGAVTRLRDMGIDSFLLAATLRGILSQRLVRKLCGVCSPDGELNGCKECNHSGYSGRTVIYEVFELGDDAIKAIGDDMNEEAIQSIAQTEGMVPIVKHADSLVAKLVTTKAEVLRVTRFESPNG
ncbi:MAG: GspE/PulE family protein [Chloroflexota bacterium]